MMDILENRCGTTVLDEIMGIRLWLCSGKKNMHQAGHLPANGQWQSAAIATIHHNTALIYSHD
jgi:hypothetical protein